MGYLHLIFLASIQGLTEFIPVSSSAHLVVLPIFFNLEAQGIGIDIAVHIGSLIAVCQIFRKDILTLLTGMKHLFLKKQTLPEPNLFLLTIITTIPIVVITIFFVLTGLINYLRNIYIIGIACIVFAIPLFLVDKASSKSRTIDQLRIYDALYIGLWQSIAIIPGASRSGCCITGSLIRGFKSKDSAHISLIMSVPTIIGSGALLVIEVLFLTKTDLLMHGVENIIYCIIFSYFTALISIKLFFYYIQKVSFLPFVIYRIAFGSFILFYLLVL